MGIIIQNIEMYRGSHRYWNVTVKNSAGSPVNLTGASIRFTVRSSVPPGSVTADTDAVFTLTVGAGITILAPATNGIFEIEVVKAKTDSLNIGSQDAYYLYGLEYIPSGQTDPIMLGQGTFTIKPDIVRGTT